MMASTCVVFALLLATDDGKLFVVLVQSWRRQLRIFVRSHNLCGDRQMQFDRSCMHLLWRNADRVRRSFALQSRGESLDGAC